MKIHFRNVSIFFGLSISKRSFHSSDEQCVLFHCVCGYKFPIDSFLSDHRRTRTTVVAMILVKEQNSSELKISFITSTHANLYRSNTISNGKQLSMQFRFQQSVSILAVSVPLLPLVLLPISKYCFLFPFDSSTHSVPIPSKSASAWLES